VNAEQVERFRQDGYLVRNGVLSSHEVSGLRQAVAEIPESQEVCRRRGVYGVRNLLEICPEVRRLAADMRIRRFVTPILGDRAFAARAIFFDKSPDANWSLGWHQDNVVSVAQRREAPEFVGWSQKAGVWQVRPPADVLARMVAVRVHLDNCGTDNGPLRVLPGSHRCGWIDDLDAWKKAVAEVHCTVGCGGVVVICPLTLHASADSRSGGHRRVIHIEYAADELPHGLLWNNRVSSF
jgi:ectoine hydroxylase-related dioxygenase (phytanoyl-CoA dioxygenase family)